MNLWNVQSSFYNFLRSLPGIRTFYQKEINNCKTLLGKIKLPETVLDLGTGTGSSLSIFPPKIQICLDSSLPMLQKIRGNEGYLKINGDASLLPIKKASVSFISAIGLTEYIKNKSECLKQINTCLTPNGFLLITISHPCFLNKLRNLTGHPIHTISEADWERLLTQNGFKNCGKTPSPLQTQYLLQKVFSL